MLQNKKLKLDSMRILLTMFGKIILVTITSLEVPRIVHMQKE